MTKGPDPENAGFRLRKVMTMKGAIVVDRRMVYTAHDAVPVTSKRAARVLDIAGIDSKALDLDDNSFLIESPEKSPGVVMTCPSPRDKQEWIAALVSAYRDPVHATATPPRDRSTRMPTREHPWPPSGPPPERLPPAATAPAALRPPAAPSRSLATSVTPSTFTL